MKQRKNTEIRVNLDGLEDLKRQLGKKYMTRVGILGGAGMHKEPVTKNFNGRAVRVASKTDSPLSNADVGLLQELGSEEAGIPPRSFLRMPAELKKREIVKFLGSSKVKGLIKSGNYRGVFAVLGVFVEGIVDDAFASRGFGKWAPNAESTIARKGSSAPLIDTAQLRRSITSDVAERKK